MPVVYGLHLLRKVLPRLNPSSRMQHDMSWMTTPEKTALPPCSRTWDGTLSNIAETSLKSLWCIVSPTSLSPFLTVSSFQLAGQQKATTRNSMFQLPVPRWWRAHSSLTPSVYGMYYLSKSWTLQHWMSSRPGSATSTSPSLMSSCHQFLILYIFFCLHVYITSLNAPQHLCEYTPRRSFCTVSEEEEEERKERIMNEDKRLGTDPVTLSIKLSAIVMQP